MYRVCWKHLKTGKTGQSEPLPYDTALARVRAMNHSCKGEIFHWAERVREETPNDPR